MPGSLNNARSNIDTEITHYVRGIRRSKAHKRLVSEGITSELEIEYLERRRSGGRLNRGR